MADRYLNISKFEKPRYCAGFPVLIEVTALYSDTALNQLFLLIKFRNIGYKNIVSCKIDVRAYEINGDMLNGIEGFHYLDILIKPGDIFGNKTPIVLPDRNTRKYEVLLKEITFDDGSVQKNDNESYFEISDLVLVNDVLVDKELVKQYKIEVAPRCSGRYFPQMTGGLFICSCGSINLDTNDICYNCGYSYYDLSMMCSDEYLAHLAKERLIREAEEKRKAEEKRLNRNKRIKKLIAIISPIAAIIIAVIALFPSVIRPFSTKLLSYFQAKKLMENKAYDTAYEMFTQLEGFYDSSDLSQEAIYRKADDYFSDGLYEESIISWAQVSSYSDSSERINQAIETWHNSDYQKALSMKDEGKFLDAEQAFIDLGEYSDSSTQSVECRELYNKELYDNAVELMSKGSYSEATEIFTSLGEYSDSNNKIHECEELQTEADYQKAKKLFELKDYKQAIDIYDDIFSYKDSRDLLDEARYEYGKSVIETNPQAALDAFRLISTYKDVGELKQKASYYYGVELLQQKEYHTAVTKLKDAKGYKDSKELIKEAQYGYVNAHKNSDDGTTYEYLKSLKKAKYKDSAKIYKKLYAWHIDVIAVNDTKDSTYDDYYSLSRYDTMYFHFIVSGGPPVGNLNFTAKAKWPDGGTTKVKFKNYSDGDESWVRYWYNNPYYGATGKLKVTFYDNSGNKIGSASVYIV